MSAVSFEGDNIVFRFPPLPEGVKDRGLPEIGEGIRRGKNAYWLPIGKNVDWQTELVNLLDRLEKVFVNEVKG